MKGTRPEVQLLLACARVALDAGRVEHVRALLRRDLDWAWLLRAARRHATAPLLHWHLSRLAPGAVPAPFGEELRQWFRDNAGRNLLLTGQLLKLLRLFADRGVRAVPFKGPTLAALAYGNLALRQFLDLDLLVLPADLPRARSILAAEGYRSRLPLAPAQEEAYLTSIGQMPFVNDGRTCMVELHARIAPRDFYFPLGLERLWPRLRPVSLGGSRVQTLAGEDLLLVLCAHGAKHQWGGLGWVCDVAELLRVEPALNWAAVADEARSLRCERILLLGPLLAHDLLDAPVPADVLRRARGVPAVRALAARVAKQMFREGDGRAWGLENGLFQLRVRERLWDGLRYTLSLALEPTVADWTAVRVPAPFSFLYHLLRPVRLALKYGRLALDRRQAPKRAAVNGCIPPPGAGGPAPGPVRGTPPGGPPATG
jgi:hypothetical protein